MRLLEICNLKCYVKLYDFYIMIYNYILMNLIKNKKQIQRSNKLNY